MSDNVDKPSDDLYRSHRACNDALAISLGVEVLRKIPEEYLSPAQIRAMALLKDASSRLVEYLERMNAEEPESEAGLVEHELSGERLLR